MLGPVASFLKIVPGKEEFAAVAEFALGSGTLDRFIVTNDSDSAVIRKLRSDAGCYQDCGIFQVAATSNRFSIPPKPNMEGIETVASVLTVENDIVFNCLVDNCRIETIGLARDRKDSENKLLVRNGNGSSIRGSIKKVYLPNGDNWTVKGGAFAVFSNEKRLRQTIGVDSSAAIEGAKAEEEAILHTLRLKEQEESKLQHDHTKSQREWNQAKKAVQKNDSYINDLSMKIDGLRQEIDASANFTVDTSEFEEMVQEAQDALASHVSDEQKYSSELESLHPKVLLVREKLDSWTLRNSKALEDVNAAENDLTQFLETQTQQMDQLEKKRRKLKTYQDNILKWQQDITQIENDREAALAKARIMQFRYNVRPIDDSDDENHVSDRSIKSEPTDEDLQAIPPQKAEREPKYYQVRMQKTKEKIEKESARRKVSREDASVAFERYKRAERELDAKMTDIENTEAKIKEMNLDVENRQARWEDFRGTLAKNIGLKFDQMLALNKYTGTLDFNHECHTLDLAVQKTTSVNASQSKDVKALRYVWGVFETQISVSALFSTPFITIYVPQWW